LSAGDVLVESEEGVLAGYRNEMLDEWVGGLVLLGLQVAPELDLEEAEHMGADPTFVKSHLKQSMRVIYRFVSYDEIGITIRMVVDIEDEEQPLVFVPWSAVLRVEKAGS
jgi:hypothetical protein